MITRNIEKICIMKRKERKEYIRKQVKYDFFIHTFTNDFIIGASLPEGTHILTS